LGQKVAFYLLAHSLDTLPICAGCPIAFRRMNGFGPGNFCFKFDHMKKRLVLVLLLIGILLRYADAQTTPFEAEVRQISTEIRSAGWFRGSTVFTGSSTIRLWKTIREDLGEETLINTGFGGSKASDLETHLFPLVIQFEPKRVFIYEGDNDLWANVEVASILTSLDHIVTRLHLIDPEMEIFLIGAKPSPSRWEKRASYLIFNQKLSEYCLAKEKVEYVDTWNALTDSAGNPRPELYLQDQLHLNEQGYKIWTEIFKSFFE
jgi:lysophospholipase L1-like esterase